MKTALFIGRKTTFKRGGRLVFETLYKNYNYKKVIVELDSTNFSISRSFVTELFCLRDLFFLRKIKIDIIIVQHNDLREIALAIFGKILHPHSMLMGPLYHFENSSLNPLHIPLKVILVKINQKISFLFYLNMFNIILTEDDSIAAMIHQFNKNIKVIVERLGARGDISTRDGETGRAKNKSIDILYLGAIEPSKGIWDFFEAIMSLNRSNIRICVSGFSTKEMTIRVDEFLTSRKLENVDFRPNVTDKEKYDILTKSKILVVPSFYEGVPITFQEAMISRCLVLAYYLPSYSYIKDRIFSVMPHKTFELASEITRILDNYGTYSNIIEENFAFANRNTSDLVARRVIDNVVSAL